MARRRLLLKVVAAEIGLSRQRTSALLAQEFVTDAAWNRIWAAIARLGNLTDSPASPGEVDASVEPHYEELNASPR